MQPNTVRVRCGRVIETGGSVRPLRRSGVVLLPCRSSETVNELASHVAAHCGREGAAVDRLRRSPIEAERAEWHALLASYLAALEAATREGAAGEGSPANEFAAVKSAKSACADSGSRRRFDWAAVLCAAGVAFCLYAFGVIILWAVSRLGGW